jgi:formylglycine-generating enzyme required for sulfatase activity/serine/threonine protein phosphatase PrpC
VPLARTAFPPHRTIAGIQDMTTTPVNLQFEIAGDQISGARDYQEDAFLITTLGDSADTAPVQLAIVADGMGGHAAGNVASNLAVQAFNKFITGNYPAENIPQLLRDAVTAANKGISEAVANTAALQGMGSTFVGVLIDAGKLWWISVGDSHLYLVRDQRLVKKNAEHTYGAYLEKMAALGQQITPDARFSSRLLMSALTGSDVPEIDCPNEPLELQLGDHILIASDGLDSLSAESITERVLAATSAKACTAALLQAVDDIKAPKQDNTTVVAITCNEAAPLPSAAIPAAYQMVVDALRDNAERREAPAQTPATSAEKSAAKSTVWIGAAAGALLALGLAGYFLWKPSGTPAVSRSVAEQPPAPTTHTAPQPTADSPEKSAAEQGPAPKSLAQLHDNIPGGGHGPSLVMLPGGRYKMGGGGGSAQPKHEVNVPQFAIGKHEVTLAEYARFANATNRPTPGLTLSNSHPMVMVSWADAEAYAKWLSQQTGHKYRLPSEAEWEYAAGAGAGTPFWWGEELGESKAQCQVCNPKHPPSQPAKVGSFPANSFGLFDTAGNASEWVQDCYHPNYEGAPEDGSAWQEMGCAERVYRGGGFRSPSAALHTSSRSHAKPSKRADDLGFRVAREP